MKTAARVVGSSGLRKRVGPVPRPRNDAARHLTVISRDLQNRMTTGLVEEEGFDSLRPRLGPLFSLIWTQPRPITQLAQRLGISKQACSQLVNLAERAGYVERRDATDDRRSKLVHLSGRGRAVVRRSIEIIRRTDDDYAAIVGPRAYQQFTAAIVSLYKVLNVPAKTDLAFLEQATRTVGALPLVTERALQELMVATAARGHAGLKMSHAQVLPFVGAGGARIWDIARIHDAGHAAISATARDLTTLGYLRRECDPLDRRGALLFLTDRGVRLVEDSIHELELLTRRIAKAVGSSALARFLATAERLHAALEPGIDIFDLCRSPRTDSADSARRSSTRDELDVHRLASRLRRELGQRRSLRLAGLLQDLSSEAAH